MRLAGPVTAWRERASKVGEFGLTFWTGLFVGDSAAAADELGAAADRLMSESVFLDLTD